MSSERSADQRESLPRRGAEFAFVVATQRIITWRDVLPVGAAGFHVAADRVAAEPIVYCGNRSRYATRIVTGAIDIELGGNQLRNQGVGHVPACWLLHDRDRRRLGIGLATDVDVLHAPRFGVIRPIADCSNT